MDDSRNNNINLEEISKIPEKEFRQRFSEWLEGDDVARSLQAKLRKDLIDNFNKTTLGKKIICHHIRSQRLVLSPLILALNTLVAEFLYAQNCHFTLSVFSTEVPYRNTLPDFENSTHFRFSEREIFEIFEAISSNFDDVTKTQISNQYLQESNGHSSVSLLFTVFKNMFRVERTKDAIPPPAPPAEEKSQKNDSKSEFYRTNFRYLNKYLVILSRKVKEMSLSLEQLEKRDAMAESRPGRKSVQTRKFESLNKSLNKISETLRHLSLSKRKNKKISAIVAAIDSMSKQFERCSSTFVNISKGSKTEEKSYDDWLVEMKTSRNGRKFLEKIEASLSKTLEKEKERISKAFDVKLQNQKELIKLKYKQKFLKQIGKHNASSKDEASESSRRINEGIEKKLLEFESKHQELMKRIKDAEEMVAVCPDRTELNVQRDLPTVPLEVLPKAVPNGAQQRKEVTNQSNQTDEQPLPQPKTPEIRLNDLVQTITEQDRHIDHIVFDAKLRIQELEYESNQLDRSFQDYLQRQRKEKSQIEENATAVWENYAMGKSMLSRKCTAMRTSRKSTDVLAAGVEDQKEMESPYTNFLNIPKISIDCMPTEVLHQDDVEDGDGESFGTFENPYRKLQEGILLKNDIKVVTNSERTSHLMAGRNVLDSPTSSVGRQQQQECHVSGISSELDFKDTTLEGLVEVSPSKSSSTTTSVASSKKGIFQLRKVLTAEPIDSNKDEKGHSQFTSQIVTTDWQKPNGTDNNNPNGNAGRNIFHQDEKDEKTTKNNDEWQSPSFRTKSATTSKDSMDMASKDIVVDGRRRHHSRPADNGCANLEIPLYSPNDKSSASVSVSHQSGGSSSYRLDMSTGHDQKDGDGSKSGSDFWN